MSFKKSFQDTNLIMLNAALKSSVTIDRVSFKNNDNNNNDEKINASQWQAESQ